MKVGWALALPGRFRGDARVWGRSGRSGGDLLFRALRRSTIGAEGFHGRVRDGIGCFAPRYGHQAFQKAEFRDQISERCGSVRALVLPLSGGSELCACLRKASAALVSDIRFLS